MIKINAVIIYFLLVYTVRTRQLSLTNSINYEFNDCREFFVSLCGRLDLIETPKLNNKLKRILPWQLLTVPFPAGLISSRGWRHGRQCPTVSIVNKPYWMVTWYLVQLMNPSLHEQLKQAPENQLVPCSLTSPFSSAQAGRESLVQEIFSLPQIHLVVLLLNHSWPSTYALPFLSQQPFWVFEHCTLKSGEQLQVTSGFGFQVCCNWYVFPSLSLHPEVGHKSLNNCHCECWEILT